MARHDAAGDHIHAVPAKGPVLDLAAVAILRQHQALPPQQREMLAELAVFLARVEGSSSVTAAHVAAAADIAQGNALAATAAEAAAEEAAAAKGNPGATLNPAAPGRRLRQIVAASVIACALAAGLATASLLRPHDRTAMPPRAETPATAPPKPALAAEPPAPAAKPMQPEPAPAPAQPVPGKPVEFALPAAVPPRVFVAYPRGDAAGQQHAAGLVQALRAQGYEAADPEPGAPRQRQPWIGYFFAEDAGAASALAHMIATMDPAWQDAAHPQLPATGADLPRPGSIVVTLPAREPAAQRHG